MKKYRKTSSEAKLALTFFIATCLLAFTGCTTGYKAKPLSFKTPAAFDNAVSIGDTQIGAKAYVDPAETKKAFGFDIHGAGMLPVQVVFDNQGSHPLEIKGDQTFLEDKEGNLWPILSNKIAYERAAKYAETKQMFKEGVSKGLLGAAAGSIIGAAVGIVTGEGVAASAGKGAALGAAAGSVAGAAGTYGSGEARRGIISDLNEKSLQNRAIGPKSLAYGFLFFPGEARSAQKLRLQLIEVDSGEVHNVNLNFSPG